LVLGYEPWALDRLLRKGVLETDIVCGRSGRELIPVFTYDFEGVSHRYYPDIRICNTIIEVKGTYTFIGSKDTFKRNKLKRRSVVRSNPFKLMLFDDRGGFG
jgi:hypothetical protein